MRCASLKGKLESGVAGAGEPVIPEAAGELLP